MRAALHSGNQVNVAFRQQFAAFWQPEQRPVNRFNITGEAADKRLLRQSNQAVDRFHQIISQAIFITPALLGVIELVLEDNLHARAQYRLGL